MTRKQLHLSNITDGGADIVDENGTWVGRVQRFETPRQKIGRARPSGRLPGVTGGWDQDTEVNVVTDVCWRTTTDPYWDARAEPWRGAFRTRAEALDSLR